MPSLALIHLAQALGWSIFSSVAAVVLFFILGAREMSIAGGYRAMFFAAVLGAVLELVGVGLAAVFW